MELLLALIVLYAAQCLRRLPAGSATLEGLRVPSVLWLGRGWRPLNPLPFSPTRLGARLPIVEALALEGNPPTTKPANAETPGGWRLRAVAPVARFALGDAPGLGPELLRGSGDGVDLRGRVVRVAERPFARAVGKGHAESLQAFVRDLAAAADGPSTRARIETEIDGMFDLARHREEQARFVRATRTLSWLSLGYFTALFAALPPAIWWLHEELGILAWLPFVVAFHTATLVALAMAHRRLMPDRGGERVELLISAALYPPALLRGLQELCDTACSTFHPAVLAATLTDEPARRGHLRSELARLVYLEGAARENDDCPSLATLEYRALLGLLAEIGEDPTALLRPPQREDASARYFCPACLAEYRRRAGACTDCGIALEAYEAAP